MKKLLFSIITLALLAGCDREIPSPVTNPINPDLPPTPLNLDIEVGDRLLHLTWTISDSSMVSAYRIFQADSLFGDYILVDSSTATEANVMNLQNGRRYFYKVSAVGLSGLEGQRTAAAYGTPNLFSIIINDGQQQTSTRNVVLTMVAPSNTALMMIANSDDFSQSSWEPYVGTKPWILTQNPGVKTVYAVFRDNDANTSWSDVSDEITYEILDFEYSILINDDAELAYSRDVSLDIVAPSGTSFMIISNSPDFTGSQWEGFAGTKQWHISSDIAANRDVVGFFVLFRDQNGDSVLTQASDSITLASADPVVLFPVFQQPDNYQAISLEWTRTLSADFHSYRLFRSRGSNTADSVITNIFDGAQSAYTDVINITDLPDDTPDSVYYKVRFYSVYNDSSDSEPILIVLRNTQPEALSGFIRDISYVIDTLTGIDLFATLGWSMGDIPDFESYVIYEGTDLDTNQAAPVFFEYNQEVLSYQINKSNVDTLEVYYYWLKMFDLGGQSSEFSMPDSIYR
ncbi:MAG: fibronectin type III domain-containing protein [candidate division Zixibacteria bacterium]|nr:fibronectin type III domain-containing protein [candidate division Zixibacteria bacterium]